MKKKYLTNKEKGGFRVPEDYFEEFGARFFSKLEIENQEPVKVFEQEPIASGFKVPQGYFQNFEAQLPEETKVVPLFNKKRWIYAASIAAALVLVFSVVNPFSTSLISFSDIAHDSIEEYIENDNIDFSDMEMQFFLSEETDFPQPEFNTITEESIFDYLINNNSEELSFINQ